MKKSISFFIVSTMLLSFTTCKSDLDKNAVQEGYISVTGGRIWYKIMGADLPGVPLIVIHGGPGITHDYLEDLWQLADERPVVLYDQLGSGNSDQPSDTSLWRIDRFIDEFSQLIKNLNFAKYHILGQSWGTMIGSEFIIRNNPEELISFIAAAPCLSTSRWKNDARIYIDQLPDTLRQAVINAEASGDFSQPDYLAAVDYYYKLHVCRIQPFPLCLEKALQKSNAEIYETMWGPSEFSLTGNLKDFDNTENLKLINVPVLFTCGEFDEASPGTTEYYHLKCPGSKYKMFNEASHTHNLEKKEEFLSCIRDFLKESEKNK